MIDKWAISHEVTAEDARQVDNRSFGFLVAVLVTPRRCGLRTLGLDVDHSERLRRSQQTSGDGAMSHSRAYADGITSASAHGPTVFVVDGNQSLRESLESVIRCAGFLLRWAASAEEFLAYPSTIAPGCVLSELCLPGLSGLELQRRVAERTELPIIFMSGHASVQTAVRAVRSGALDVLIKPLAPDGLLRQLRYAIACSRAALSHRAHLQEILHCYGTLSAREREVMSLVVAGRLNKQISGELGICEGTVKAHRCALMRKMRARSLAELIFSLTQLPATALWRGGDSAHPGFVAGVASGREWASGTDRVAPASM